MIHSHGTKGINAISHGFLPPRNIFYSVVDFPECVSCSPFVMLVEIIQHLGDSIINPVPYSYRILIFEGEEVFVEKVGSSRNENLIDYLSFGN